MPDKATPPVPGLARMGWLMLMQPGQLRKLVEAWDLEEDSSLPSLVSQLKSRAPLARELLKRWALLLLVSALAMGLASGDLPEALHALAQGKSVLGSRSDFELVVAISLFFSLFNTTGAVAFFVTYCVASSVLPDVALNVALSAMICVSFNVTAGVVMALAHGIFVGVVRGWASVDTHGVLYGVILSLTHSLVVAFAVFRLFSYPLEALISVWLNWRVLHAPERSLQLSRWLPFLHHDLLFLPLPGLHSFLLRLAEVQPSRTKELLARAADSVGQKRIARRVSVELQARDLEKSARNRLFARVADLDLPFLPPAHTLDPASPLWAFKTAASDLNIDVRNHLQRRLALERARKTLEGFIATSTASRAPSAALARRLLSTARLWLDVVREEEHQLAAEEARHPQVPRVFIAGAPLTLEAHQGESLFKGRRDLAGFVEHDLDPNRRGVLVIVGQRRMGKSSFRNWLPRLLGTGTRVLVANFQELSGHPHRSAPQRWLLELVAACFPSAPPPPTSPHWTEALDWLRAREAAPGGPGVLVVIDEVERVQDGILAGWCSIDFLDFLRAAGDTLRRIRFLLLTAYPLHQLGPHWGDRLISSTTRGLSYLDTASAEELVRQPVPGFPDIYPEGGVERILRETRCHPFLIQKVCDELCKYLNEHGGCRRATEEELSDVLDRVTEEKLFDELWRQRTPEEQRSLHRLSCAQEPLHADLTLRQLAREGYVELHGSQATLAVPLFGAWIRLTHGDTPEGGTAHTG